MRLAVLTVLSLFVVLAAQPARATPEIFFDTLGQLGDVYEDTDVFSLIGDHSAGLGGGDWFQGYRFTSAGSGPLQSIEVAIGHLDAPEAIEFRLYADAGGSLGALLETIFVQTTAGNFDGSIEIGNASGATVLTAGTSYWLMATSNGPTIWFNNELGVSLPRLWTPLGPGAPLSSDTTTTAAFRINGPPIVPLSSLPSRLLLVALAVSFVTAIGLRQRTT